MIYHWKLGQVILIRGFVIFSPGESLYSRHRVREESHRRAKYILKYQWIRVHVVTRAPRKGGLLYSGILRQLAHKIPAYPRGIRGKRNSPRGKLRPDFRPGFCARLTLTVRFRCRDFHLCVFDTSLSRPRPMDRPTLARILTTDLHCLKFVPPIPTVLFYRGSLSRALTTRYFFCFFFFLLSGRVRGRKRAISTFPTIKELSQRARLHLPGYLLDIYRCH